MEKGEQDYNEYEEMRKEKEKEKLELLRKLGILNGIENSRTQEPVISVRKTPPVKRKLSPKSSEPVRKSLRLAKTPIGKFMGNIKEERTEEPKQSPIRRKFFEGPEQMIRISEDDVKPSLESLLPYLKETSNGLGVGSVQKSLDCFKMSLKKMVVSPEYVKKVGTSQTYSLVVHPSESKLLIITGDREGYLGFWDARNSTKEQEIYRAHKNPVYCLSVCTYNPVKLYATAFDGVVRNCDLEKMQFSDIYVTESQDHTVYHAQMSPHTLLVAHGCGDVALVDIRARQAKNSPQWIECHARSVRTIHPHPVLQHEFVTASGVGEVGIWDIRKHKKQKPLLLLPHPKGLKSAFYSPGGGMLLTCCNDDRIRIYSSDKNHLIMSKVHNMQTGQWLRPFQAKWHPQRDDSFIIGSMNRPRQVDVYGIHGLSLHSLRSDNLATVLSNCQFHASQSIIVGANSSGYVHVFQKQDE